MIQSLERGMAYDAVTADTPHARAVPIPGIGVYERNTMILASIEHVAIFAVAFLVTCRALLAWACR